MALLDDHALIHRVLDHVDHKTTDLGDGVWREPVANYLSEERFQLELQRVFRRTPTPFCPSAALPNPGDYVARDAAHTPILAVRGNDGVVRAFRNACRHRGVQLVDGVGCKSAFTCRYHAWTYGLDGKLRGIPDERGFPGLDKSQHGLVPVKAVEKHGLVFITQDGDAEPDEFIDDLEGLIGPDFKVLPRPERTDNGETPVNWKLTAEGFLEGYHIRSTHAETFYPRQYDNLNVVEAFGRNSRITFPYRAVEKLRGKPPEEWSIYGAVTTVYHIFPNVLIATFPSTISITILEPMSAGRLRSVGFTLSKVSEREDGQKAIKVSQDFVKAGGAEDAMVVAAAQRGLRSGANEYLTFGRFESLLARLHRNLNEVIGEA